MTDPYIGEIRLVAFNRVPAGWAACDGQLIPLQQNTALYALLGLQYGGDGVSTFALPDLRGRVPVGAGAGRGLTPLPQGSLGGAEQVTLKTTQLPAHTHETTNTLRVTTPVTNGRATTNRPSGAVPAAGGSYATTGTTTSNELTVSGTVRVEVSGNSQPVAIRTPFLSLQYIIALQGIFPAFS